MSLIFINPEEARKVKDQEEKKAIAHFFRKTIANASSPCIHVSLRHPSLFKYPRQTVEATLYQEMNLLKKGEFTWSSDVGWDCIETPHYKIRLNWKEEDVLIYVKGKEVSKIKRGYVRMQIGLLVAIGLMWTFAIGVLIYAIALVQYYDQLQFDGEFTIGVIALAGCLLFWHVTLWERKTHYAKWAAFL